MLFQYWPTANGAEPTLKQHRVRSSSLQGELSAFGYTRAVCVWLEQATQSSVYTYCYFSPLVVHLRQEGHLDQTVRHG